MIERQAALESVARERERIMEMQRVRLQREQERLARMLTEGLDEEGSRARK